MEVQSPLKPLVISEMKPPMNITYVTNSEGLVKLRDYLERKSHDLIPIFCLDTETNFVKDFWTRCVRLIQIGDRVEQYIIDLLAWAGSEDRLLSTQKNWGKNNGDIYKEVFDVIGPALTTNRFLKVGQNLAFEYQVFHWNFGLRIWNLFSIDMAERVLWAGAHSLKQYSFFSLEEIFARYFKYQIDKNLQGSFDLKSSLTQAQIEYAALDVRLPMSVYDAQMRILTKDQLLATTQIENDALGTYADMHLYGMRLNKERWIKRVQATIERRNNELKEMDAVFIPVVGKKTEAIDYDKLARLEDKWRNGFEVATKEEMALASAKRQEKEPVKKSLLSVELNGLVLQRKAKKAEARKKYQEENHKKTEALKIIEKCEGDAFINYGSNVQLMDALNQLPEIRMHKYGKLKDMQDETLLKYNDLPFIKTVRHYKEGKKETGTYGEQWTKTWVTKPCKEEGFLHPMDERIHAVFNQLEAESGRSSSAKPSVMNLPQEDEVRACFIADNSEDAIVTVDMNAAELRIIAELSGAKSWLDAFKANQDVHSVGTEILYPEKWPALALPDCAYYKLGKDGTPQKQKCKCPEHKKLRDGNKSTNFLLCYGGGPSALAAALDVSLEEATNLYQHHEKCFPDIWQFLKISGEQAKSLGEARDMYGRRRLLPAPTYESAIQWIRDEYPEKLALPPEQCEAEVFKFKSKYFRQPNEEELFALTHRNPDQGQIKWALRALWGSIERKGKNHAIQATNCSIAKRAMGAGIDKNGKGYLWHLLPQYNAKIISFIHDELVVNCPKENAEEVAKCVVDAIDRAASEVFKILHMTCEYRIADRWMK